MYTQKSYEKQPNQKKKKKKKQTKPETKNKCCHSFKYFLY